MGITLLQKWICFKLSLSCKLWTIRGLKTCPYHGFHAQSWWNGYCKECKEVPNPPPMEDTCTFCGEEKSVVQRQDPNGSKDLWSLCWECDKFLDWSSLNSMCLITGKELLPFDQWLFDKEKVYPKHEYSSFVIEKK